MTQHDFGETRKHFVTMLQLSAAVRWCIRQEWFFRAVFMVSESQRQKTGTAVQGAVEGKPARSNKLEKEKRRDFSAAFSSWNEI